MGILVDYSCPACLGRHEARVDSPPPASRRCPACGGAATRSWSPVGIVTHRGNGGGGSPDPVGAGRPLCAANPDVPGLCHMSPEAGRLWLARARHDGRAVERELERQEGRAAGAPAPAAAAHGHSHAGSGHRHSHGVSET